MSTKASEADSSLRLSDRFDSRIRLNRVYAMLKVVQLSAKVCTPCFFWVEKVKRTFT